MSLRNRYCTPCFAKWYPASGVVRANDFSFRSISLGNLVHGVRYEYTLAVFNLLILFVRSFWWERRGDREWIARRNFDKKIRRDLRFLSRAVTRRNTGVEMDRCVHSKCHRNAGITLTEVSRPFVPPPSPVYLRSRERRTHATQQLFYIRQDSSTCGKHAKSLLEKSHVATK